MNDLAQCREEFLALCRKVSGCGLPMLTFTRGGPDWWPPGLPESGRNYDTMLSTRFELRVGYGYFTGALLTVTATPTVSGSAGWRSMQEYPVDEGVDRFLDLTLPEKPA